MYVSDGRVVIFYHQAITLTGFLAIDVPSMGLKSLPSFDGMKKRSVCCRPTALQKTCSSTTVQYWGSVCDCKRIKCLQIKWKKTFFGCKWTAFIYLFSNHGHSLPNIYTFIHTFTHQLRCQPCKATASSLGAVRVRCLAQGHHDTLRSRGSN